MSSALRPPTTLRLPEGRRIHASTTKSLLAYTASGCRNGANRWRVVGTAFCHDRRDEPLPRRAIFSGSDGQGLALECRLIRWPHPDAAQFMRSGTSFETPSALLRTRSEGKA